MKKKWLIALIGILGITLLLLLLLPVILKPRIEALLVSSIDEQLNAQFTTDDISLSVLRHFPNASVSMRNPRIINIAPFEGDTLFSAETVTLDLSLREVFRRGDGPRNIKAFEIDGAVLQLVVDEAGNPNYDIVKEEPVSEEGEAEGNAMVFDLEAYQIRDTHIFYKDFGSGIAFAATDIAHSGSGQFSADQSELLTESNAKLSLTSSGTTWFTDLPVRLDALLGIDLETDTYSFKHNEAYLRELPLTFAGSLTFLEEGQEWQLSVSTPDSEFQNFLALIPEQYSHYQKEFTASGSFQLTGFIKGLLNEERIPEFDIQIQANDGFVQYAGMPKALERIQMDMRIANQTGKSTDTFIEIGNAAFAIGRDEVQMSARIEDLTERILVDARTIAAMDLSQINEAYSEPSWQDLKGRVEGNLSASFALEDVRNNRYSNAKASGDLEVSGLEYRETDGSAPMTIEYASMTFDPQRTEISQLKGAIGTSDFAANGTLTNLLGYLFHDEVVKGSFVLSSQTLDLNEFLVEERDTESGDDTGNEKFEIPGFLDATIRAEAETVYYDDLELTKVSGDLIIRDKGIRLENAKSDFLGGQLQLDGVVDSSKDQPVFAVQLTLQDNAIAELFKATTFFQKLAPLAKGLQGTMDSRFVINGNFSDGFELDFSSLSGQAQTELKALERIVGESSLIHRIQDQLNFLESSDLDLKGLKTVLKFQDGKVEVSPFEFMYKDIPIRVRGSHTFDARMDYSIAMDVPAYYLGDEVNRLIAQLNDPELQEIPVPVQVSLRGNYEDPTIQTDLTQSVSKLTSRLVTLQKEKAVDRGKEEVRDLIGGIFGSDTDSAQVRENKPSVGDVLGEVLVGTTEKDSSESTQDTASTKTPSLQETATGILGGLLKKKKKDSVPKDSINR